MLFLSPQNLVIFKSSTMTRSCGIYWWFLWASLPDRQQFWGRWCSGKIWEEGCETETSEHRWFTTQSRKFPCKKKRTIRLWWIKESKSKSETEFWGLAMLDIAISTGANSQCETAQLEMWQNPPDQQAVGLKGLFLDALDQAVFWPIWTNSTKLPWGSKHTFNSFQSTMWNHVDDPLNLVPPWSFHLFQLSLPC